MSVKVGLGANEDDLDIQGEIDFDFFDREQKQKDLSKKIELPLVNKQNHIRKTLIETVIPSLIDDSCENGEKMKDEDKDDCHSVSSSVSMTDSEESSLSEESFDDLTESGSITDVTPLTSPCCDSPLPEFLKNDNCQPRRKLNDYAEDKMSNDFNMKKRENVKFADNVEWNSTSKNNTVDLNALLCAIKQLELEQNKNSSDNKAFQAKFLNSARKNMSFSNEEVRQIDHENQRLLKKILTQQNRPTSKYLGQKSRIPQSHVSSSAINRLKQQRQIELENLALLKRIESAKPSRDISRTHLLRDYERLSSFSYSSRSSSRPQSATRKPYHSGRNSLQQSVRSSSLTSLQSSNKLNPISVTQSKQKNVRPFSTSSKSYTMKQNQASDCRS
ncbi:cilia- and flagella-associated protein 97-like isoform X1 [Centruroides sculpturatus]|uniref:cilia- and flagella-associated protein 97-like isoform X1 n=1 Tax=Centruroides sculpturatus TaxID=218467 RepID=UPI000C6D5FDD|nr:cilia- and flagella-associated protein 97-like isoform X1 [Centruroides sculpturatus]